jgi:flavin-dependent thymidylate synthase
MKNKVELLGWYGGDLLHALSAWTSTRRDITPEKTKRIPALLKDVLGANKHGTPFEKSALHFLVTTDIATHIHLLKHRIGVSINAESARYKELKEDKFYLPTDWPEEEQRWLQLHYEESFRNYHRCLARLIHAGYSRQRAKESARFYLPYGIQIEADIMFNFRSFVHFQHLRNSEHAQLEVREIAKEMLRLIELTGEFTNSLKAFNLCSLTD